MDHLVNRREFLGAAATATTGLLAKPIDTRSILNYNSNMEYRRLGKTGMMVSAVSLGGHWKRVGATLKQDFRGEGFAGTDMSAMNNKAFLQNRHDVVSRCIDVGINYVDACSGPEVMAYSTVLKGRRQKMFVGYSWGIKESRKAEWRSSKKLLQSLDEGLKASGLDYVDLWRISLPMDQMPDQNDMTQSEEGAVEALDKARKAGKVRFTGVSSHNRAWLRYLADTHPDVIQVVLFPYTANSKEMPDDSIFDVIKKRDTGVLGIKPFADNSLFQGNGAPESPTATEDSKRARMALRYILGNPGISAPIPGLASIAQVDNAAQAVMERRKLDKKEKAELDRVGAEMWARLRPDHKWLKNWEYV